MGLLVGGLGIIAALLVPFMPVLAKSTTVSWPPEGRPAESTMALFVPYAPEQVHVELPCSALRSGQQRGEPTTLISSHLPGRPTDGFALTTDDDRVLVLVGGREVFSTPVPVGDCSVVLDADAGGTTVRVGDQVRTDPHAHVEEIFALATDLAPRDASALTVRATTSDWFSNTPSAPKVVLIVIQLALATGALALLASADRRRRTRTSDPLTRRVISRFRSGWPPRAVDVGVVGVLSFWLVLGPVTPDDGFASMIARQGWLTGVPSNYYRWENTSETPFALAHHVLEPFGAVSGDPMVLRMPSALAGLLTWLVLSRGAAPVLLPRMSRALGIRALLALSFLAWWLPFGMGTRPEALTALGSTVALACAVRGATRTDGHALLGLGVLAAGLATAASPIGLTSFVPFLVLAPRILRRLQERNPARPVWSSIPPSALLGSVTAVGIIAMFADQSWFGAARATELHRFYGPDVPWFQEVLRYDNLLGFGPQGSIARRVPVLLTLALLVCTALLLARGARRLPGMRLIHVAPACTAISCALLWLTPSKWTHYFGAFAGIGAAALVSSIILLAVACRRWQQEPGAVVIGLIGTGLAVLAGATSFAGTNNWFLHSHFGVLWGHQPLRPLNSPLSWLLLAGALLVVGLLRGRSRPGAPARMILRAPAVLATAAVVSSVGMLLVSFAVAPLRQQDGYSLGGHNLSRIRNGANCGIMDELVATPEVPSGTLNPGEGTDQLRGFTPGAGSASDPPGTATARWWWGSLTGGAISTGSMTSRWFSLPAPLPDREIAVSVAGRTGDGNSLTLEFARSHPDGTPRPLGQRLIDDSYKDSDKRATYPTDHVITQEPQDNPDWRTLHLDSRAVPPGADRVRVRATDATTDPTGWMAVTGPRIRAVVPLRQFLQRSGSPAPTYVDWSMTWSLPCVRDLAAVGDGLVQPPRLLFNPPDSLKLAGRAAYEQAVGGSFAGVDELGTRIRVPTRLLGTEDKPRYEQWGHVETVDYPLRTDGYDTDTTWTSRWGWHGPPRISPPLAPTSEPP
ncbi:indolylacetylinositol arabinosyltransferase [Saccharopolyspora aridisoli]|uniref:Indolylacetylinositol arabinosyltransferase n=1 Tax=Saccharopolyspora aridisoli TaxID=2530385 RepID=A0A4R4V068_9PSEU|nr:indolylacetylinositol arabinosyltransferase [Saccharopolyspora aridisoli]